MDNSVIKEFVDKTYKTDAGMTMTEIARAIGCLNTNQLNKILKELGFLYKRGSKWYLSAMYSGEDLIFFCNYELMDLYSHSLHKNQINRWNKKGYRFILELLEQNQYLSLDNYGKFYFSKTR